MMMITALKQLNIHRQNPHIKATSYYHMNWETWIFCFFQVGWSKGIQTRSKIWRCSRYLLVLTEKSCWKQLIKVRTIFPRKVRACSLVLVEKEWNYSWKTPTLEMTWLYWFSTILVNTLYTTLSKSEENTASPRNITFYWILLFYNPYSSHFSQHKEDSVAYFCSIHHKAGIYKEGQRN